MAIRSLNPEQTKWQIDYYTSGRKGKRNRHTFVGPESEARAYEMELRRQNPLSFEKSINPRIIDIFPEWLDEYKLDHALTTFKDVKVVLTHLIPHFGNYRFNQLVPSIIQSYKTTRIDEGVLKRTINKELSYFSSFIKWAVENNIASPLPFQIKKFPYKKSPKPRIPHPLEIQELIKCTEERYKPVVLLLYDTGLRREEALTLKAENVQLSMNVIIVRGKGDKERIVPITTERLYITLQEALKTIKEGYLFVNPKTKKPYNPSSLSYSLYKAAKKAKIDQKVYPHLLRHSFGTHSLLAGVGLRSLQKMMGHSSVKTTEDYTHLLGDFIKFEGKKFGDYISQLAHE